MAWTRQRYYDLGPPCGRLESIRVKLIMLPRKQEPRAQPKGPCALLLPAQEHKLGLSEADRP